MPIFMLKPETAKKLTSLMEGWVLYVRGSRDDGTLLADHSVIYLRGAAAALSQINYQNDFDKIEFGRAIDDVARDLEERGDEALREWLEKLVDPQKIAASERLSRAFGGRTKYEPPIPCYEPQRTLDGGYFIWIVLIMTILKRADFLPCRRSKASSAAIKWRNAT